MPFSTSRMKASSANRIPESRDDIVELARAAVAFVVFHVLVETEIQLDSGFDVVTIFQPARPSLTWSREAKAAGDVIRRVEGGRTGGDETETLGDHGKRGQQRHRVEGRDGGAAFKGRHRHVQHAEMIGHEERVEFPGFQFLRETDEMCLQIEVGVGIRAGITPPGGVNSDRTCMNAPSFASFRLSGIRVFSTPQNTGAERFEKAGPGWTATRRAACRFRTKSTGTDSNAASWYSASMPFAALRIGRRRRARRCTRPPTWYQLSGQPNHAFGPLLRMPFRQHWIDHLGRGRTGREHGPATPLSTVSFEVRRCTMVPQSVICSSMLMPIFVQECIDRDGGDGVVDQLVGGVHERRDAHRRNQIVRPCVSVRRLSLRFPHIVHAGFGGRGHAGHGM